MTVTVKPRFCLIGNSSRETMKRWLPSGRLLQRCISGQGMSEEQAELLREGQRRNFEKCSRLPMPSSGGVNNSHGNFITSSGKTFQVNRHAPDRAGRPEQAWPRESLEITTRKLFEPTRTGAVEVQNRIVMAPTTTHF